MSITYSKIINSIPRLYLLREDEDEEEDEEEEEDESMEDDEEASPEKPRKKTKKVTMVTIEICDAIKQNESELNENVNAVFKCNVCFIFF